MATKMLSPARLSIVGECDSIICHTATLSSSVNFLTSQSLHISSRVINTMARTGNIERTKKILKRMYRQGIESMEAVLPAHA